MKIIKLFAENFKNKSVGWRTVPKMKDCPVCFGGKKLFYRKDGKDVGIKDCYFCKGLGKVDENDSRNPFVEESKNI